MKSTWSGDQTLVAVSPAVRDFSFLDVFGSKASIIYEGEWSDVAHPLFSRPTRELDFRLKDAKLALFTSGTESGKPRLVFYSRENLLTSVEAISELFDRERIKSIFCFPQPTHVFGLALGYVQALHYNVELKFSPGRYSKSALKHWHDTVTEDQLTLGAPTHFFDLLATASSPGPSYSAIIGGAVVTPDLWMRVQKDLRIEKPSIGYGASEASPGVTHLPPGVMPSRTGDIGHPLKGVDAWFEPDHGLHVTGKNICLAYLENNELVFPTTICLRDDIEIGNLWTFKGRLSASLNRGGYKIFFENVESILKNQTIMAVASLTPDERVGEELVILHERSKCDSDCKVFQTGLEVCFHNLSLKQMLERELGTSLTGIQFIQVERLPLGENLKPDRMLAKNLVSLAQSRVGIVSVTPVNDAPSRPTSPIANETANGLSALSPWVPHRNSAVWVDRVLQVSQNQGSCEIHLDESKNYFTDDQLRVSSLIEFMAQAYAYITAQNPDIQTAPKQVFLVAIKEFEVLESLSHLSSGDKLVVRTCETHRMGPLRLIKGEVLDEKQTVLAKSQLKIFAE